MARERLGERCAARSGLQFPRANAETRLTYSGPTVHPLTSRAGTESRIADLRELRQMFTRDCFGLSSSSGRSGRRPRRTKNSSAKPDASARSQLSSDLTGIRRLIRAGIPRGQSRWRSSGAQLPLSRSRRTSQLICAADRIKPGIRRSRRGAPPATTARCATSPMCRINRSATGTSALPSTAR